jgi:PKHD-type hydroxylase
MTNTIIFPTEEVDPQNYYYFTNGLSNDEIDRIQVESSFLPFQNGGTGVENNENNGIRSSSIKWLPKTQHWGWLYDKIMNMTIEANNALWHFNLYTILDDIQYTEYYATNNGHYDWHQDFGPGNLSKRKISVTIQLSDPSEYEGGDLEYWQGGGIPITAPRSKGLVFIFPSYMMHRVTQVTSGTRRSAVLWVGGEHYR